MTTIDRLLDHGPVELKRIQNGETWRGVRHPGDDLSDLPADVRASIQGHWTPQRVAVWKERSKPEPAPPRREMSRADKFDAFLRRSGMTADEFLSELAARQTAR